MKRYRLPLSRVFPATHPKKGERTFFREKILQSTHEYYPVQCKCGWVGSSEECDCYQIGQSGDWSDPQCPKCSQYVEEFNCFPKRHTIRENVEYWKKRIDEINKGNAVLEIYEWIGKPYGKGSTTKTLFTFDKNSGIGYQELQFSMNSFDFPRTFSKNGGVLALMPGNLAKNDGLSLQDFKDWFKKSDLSKPKIIIHFTDFRY
ncbi:hypothetical protein [Bacteroides sp. 51]|uniref:hypothetical protein n=1 Tax=Bacteroides sp. 51 TaxID=2302938 RepID=UPI0013D77B7F|nr:hypothetical protein [Bacteroides sp. 51]NDV81311.1 hypothetical protein [Bacteroides sp. 51]